MCAIPGCGSGIRDFKLKGPIGEPPLGGWKLKQLPEEAAGLRDAWAAHAGRPDNHQAAIWEMMDFLAKNGVSSPEISLWIQESGPRQWCAPDPKRCEKKWRQQPDAKPEPRFFPWAKAAWENLNNALGDDVPPEALPHILDAQISKLSILIDPSSPTGCPHCHVHWLQVLRDNPRPDPPTLDAVRRWVVKIHNETREAREPVPYETIAAKFRWSDPAPEEAPASE